jgi:starch synthase (maltosyl-transferring)
MTQTRPASPAIAQADTAGPCLYYLHPLLAGPLATWDRHFERAAALGFTQVLLAPPFRPMRHGSLMLSASHDRLHPDLGWSGDAASGLAAASRMAEAAGLSLLLDVVPERVANASPLATAAGSPFSQPDTTLDPRHFDLDGDAASAPLEPDRLVALATFWSGRLNRWAELGIGGFRLTGLHHLAPGFVHDLAEGIAGCGALLYGWMEGVPIAGLAAFEGCGLDYVFSSLPWWDGHSDWFWREDAALRRIAPVIAPSEAPFGARIGEHMQDTTGRLALLRGRMSMAALLGSGWMMVMGTEFAAMRRLDPRRDEPDDFASLPANETGGLSALITRLNQVRAATPALSANSRPLLLSGAGADVLVVARPAAADTRAPGDVAVVMLNKGLRREAPVPGADVYGGLGGYHVIEPPGDAPPLVPGDYRVTTLPWRSPEGAPTVGLGASAREAARAPRIAIEAVTPSVDGGRFASRCCVGDMVTVAADIICDGHDMLAAEIRWQAHGDGATAWQRVRMRPLGNDRWSGAFVPRTLGPHRFTVEAWKDAYATYRDELSKKFLAGLDVTLEVEEGRLLIAEHARHAGTLLHDVQRMGETLLVAGPIEDKVALLLSDDTAALMRTIDPRAFATWIDPVLPLEAGRTAARFASWYEIFPRSMSDDADRHGTFDDVIRHLPRIQAMGFDVLYFPPIHPIGRTNRKGRNNALVAAPDDPGSPYGIADHTAIHPELGTFEDFRRMRDAALAHGLELALDFAVQCSPDHPWLAEHKGWFDWRPDGSIRYAENPPKKYQDIVNVDFYKDDAVDGLWRALCEVVLFWCEQGVRIFRVDNPHTKPLPFWQWMIGTVQAQHPDTLFLAEAFTKPKMMNRLAKVGFSQSYTYFTWRNTKAELQDYLIELNTTAAKDFFRPNFFVNTPDINPVFLQQSGRPGHLIRAALAATLAGLWGVYSGFELCEAAPLPGREEYLDSEKYQIRVWDWNRPGNIVREITQLNWMRRLNPALQTHLGVSFLNAGNDAIIYFEKANEDRSNVVLVAINLDPYHVQETGFEVPLWRWKLPDGATVEVDDLVFETSYRWTGKMQQVRLDPERNPYAVWRVRPAREV